MKVKFIEDLNKEVINLEPEKYPIIPDFYMQADSIESIKLSNLLFLSSDFDPNGSIILDGEDDDGEYDGLN
jgi:hypothetical protein